MTTPYNFGPIPSPQPRTLDVPLTHPFPSSYSSSSDPPSSPSPLNYAHSSPPPLPTSSAQQPPQTPPVLTPIFVDTIAREFSLEHKQTQMLHTFVGFGSLDAGLSVPDMATRVVLLAAQFGDAAERRRKEKMEEQEKTDHRAMWRDLQVRLEETFTFTRQQKTHIRGVVQDVIYEGNRTKFLKLHVDVWDAVERRKKELSLDNIFGVPGREKILGQLIKRQCSSVRNSWRTDLIASIKPKKFTSLADFVYNSANKYRMGGGGGELPQIYTIHAVLLRRFVFDNPTLITAAGAEEEDTEEPEDSDLDYEEAEGRRSRKKAKTGKIPKSASFWGGVDRWFKEEVDKRGSTLTGSKWKSYVDQLMKDDQAKFKGLLPGSSVVEERSSLLEVSGTEQPIQQTQGLVSGAFHSSGQMLESMMQGGGGYSSTR
ncbi:hypothetical protein R3P38DRAFT_2940391 [Favolaschia claudopus]|uniref:Uncharacterized protein n=1 Tax=Favolaschia claudopus TaxID=2862362 RepID=A0AAW0BPF1_9AGAR